MSTRQPILPVILLLLLSLTLGVLAESRAQHQTLSSLSNSNDRPMIAYLVARAQDCESHLYLLQQLQRPSIARTTANGGALLIGSSVSTGSVMRTIAREMPDVRARRASMLERRLLWRLGYRRTPVLIVLNASDGSVRFSAPAPLTIADRVRLLRALSAVTAG